MITYNIEAKNNIQILTVNDLMFDFDNKKILEAVEEKIEMGCTSFIVDLQDVLFINSTGLRFLLAVLTKTRNKGGETVLINVPEQVSKLLVMTKLQNMFPIYDHLDAALEGNEFKIK